MPAMTDRQRLAERLEERYRSAAPGGTEQTWIRMADLREAAAFFKTPGGQRYVQAQPQVLDDLFGQMQIWTQRLSELMVGRVRAELKKKNVEM